MMSELDYIDGTPYDESLAPYNEHDYEPEEKEFERTLNCTIQKEVVICTDNYETDPSWCEGREILNDPLGDYCAEHLTALELIREMQKAVQGILKNKKLELDSETRRNLRYLDMEADGWEDVENDMED